jgi:hypothetical protein
MTQTGRIGKQVGIHSVSGRTVGFAWSRPIRCWIVLSIAAIFLPGCGQRESTVESVLPRLGALRIGRISAIPDDDRNLKASEDFKSKVSAILAADNHAAVAVPKIVELASKGPFVGSIDLELVEPCDFAPIEKALGMTVNKASVNQSGIDWYQRGPYAFGVKVVPPSNKVVLSVLKVDAKPASPK